MKTTAYCCCLGVASMTTTYFGIVGFLPQLAAHYHVSLDTAGWLLSGYALTIALVGPLATLLTSRYNHRTVLLVSLLPFVVAGVVSALAPPFWLLIGVHLLPALLHPVFFSTALGIVATASNPLERPRLMAIIVSGIGVATVTTIPLVTYAASRGGWQLAFVLQAAASAAALLLVYRVVPSLPATAHPGYRQQLGILTRPVFVVSILVAMLLVAAWFCTYGYFATYLRQVKQLSAPAVSYQLLLFGAMGLVGNWLAGKLLGRSLPVAMFLLLAGPLLVAGGLFTASPQPALTTGLVGLWGLLYAPCFLLSSALITAAAPQAVEFANSLAASFTNLGVALGTMVGGGLIARYGIGSLPWGTAAFALGALTAALLLRWLQWRQPAPAAGPALARPA